MQLVEDFEGEISSRETHLRQDRRCQRWEIVQGRVAVHRPVSAANLVFVSAFLIAQAITGRKISRYPGISGPLPPVAGSEGAAGPAERLACCFRSVSCCTVIGSPSSFAAWRFCVRSSLAAARLVPLRLYVPICRASSCTKLLVVVAHRHTITRRRTRCATGFSATAARLRPCRPAAAPDEVARPPSCSWTRT